jgi:hypothetical protein
MPHHAERVVAPGNSKATTSTGHSPRPSLPRRDPLWHVLQLRAARSARSEPTPVTAAPGPEDHAPRIALARDRIETAKSKAADTAELAAELEQIGAELGLKSIGMVDLGTPAARIAFQVNPWVDATLDKPLEWKMTGTGQKPITDVAWKAQSLTVGTKTCTVGKSMTAHRLHKDCEPGSNSSNDKAQSDLMGKLVNAGITAAPNREEFVKGHLLNEHVGGPGACYNLFPITADANAAHLAYVEKFVKAQVVDKGNVVDYSIEVTHQTPYLEPNTKSAYCVDANFAFSWHVLDQNGKQIESHTGSVESKYGAKGTPPFSDIKQEYGPYYDKVNRGKTTPTALVKQEPWQGPSTPAATTTTTAITPTNPATSTMPISVAAPTPVTTTAKSATSTTNAKQTAPDTSTSKTVSSSSSPNVKSPLLLSNSAMPQKQSQPQQQQPLPTPQQQFWQELYQLWLQNQPQLTPWQLQLQYQFWLQQQPLLTLELLYQQWLQRQQNVVKPTSADQDVKMD